MRTDTTQIKFDTKTRLVTVPEVVWEEIRGFCRMHGEGSIPSFPVVTVVQDSTNREDYGKAEKV